MPDKPVPIVNALDAVAVTVTELPRLTDDPLIVIALFDKDALAMFVSVLSGPLIVLFVSVCTPVKVTTELSIDKVLLAVKSPPPLNPVPADMVIALYAAFKFVRASAAVVAPVPPFNTATTPVTLAAVPVVFWFQVGIAPARSA